MRGTSSPSNGARSVPACSGSDSRERARLACRRCRRRARHHRLRRDRHARPADDARPQRQRLLGLDLRRAARRGRDRHLDRRRRRAERRSAPRARSAGHRRAVVQRGHGARVLRREGRSIRRRWRRPSGAASRSGSATRSRPTQPGTKISARLALRRGRQGHHEHRRRRARQPRGRRHDRRARARRTGCSARCARPACR